MTASFNSRSEKLAPNPFKLAAISLPLLMLGQLLLAGLGLFQQPAWWDAHASLGMLLIVPVSWILIASWWQQPVRALRWWASLMALLYLLQVLTMAIGQEAGLGWLLALHPFNAGLLLLTALVLVAKIMRSHSGR
ncbi:DUF6220 domain-containing protein [Saccharospirillum sp. HFRX-1]|uniref:DUF6220 domain-containing protein n=1 Tax=unclassified Saccharospirillum TaxID=2633430 RepID=UPI003719867A